jgi:hypothetical protein
MLAGNLVPSENRLGRDQMRRVMVSVLFAVCTSTQLWAQEVKPNWPISI